MPTPFAPSGREIYSIIFPITGQDQEVKHALGRSDTSRLYQVVEKSGAPPTNPCCAISAPNNEQQ